MRTSSLKETLVLSYQIPCGKYSSDHVATEEKSNTVLLHISHGTGCNLLQSQWATRLASLVQFTDLDVYRDDDLPATHCLKKLILPQN